MAGVAGLFVFVFVSQVTVSGMLRDAAPATVLKIAPYDAQARALVAFDALVKSGKDVDRSLVADQAQLAFNRSVVNVTALRTLGLLYDVAGDSKSAFRVMQQAQAISRRDIPTQLWLLEYQSKAGNVDGTLHHYDLAMRSSRSTRGLLFPILVAAASDDGVRPSIRRMMLHKPEYWWRDYLIEMIMRGDARAAEEISRGLLDVRDPEDRALVELFLNRLTGDAYRTKSEASYEIAWRVYSAANRNSGVTDRTLRAGGFEQSVSLPMLEWALTEDIDLSAAVVGRPDGAGGRALAITAYGGRRGEVARQLVRLDAGTYRLSFESGGFGTAAPRAEARLVCNSANPSRDRLLIAVPRSDATRKTVSSPVDIPSACRWAWLIFNAANDASSQEALAWIDSVALYRTR